MNAFDACSRIRLDAKPPKGKRCPGGYSIPAGKQCRSLGSPVGNGQTRKKGGGIAGKIAATAIGLPLAAATIGGVSMATSAALKKAKGDPNEARRAEERAKNKAEAIKRVTPPTPRSRPEGRFTPEAEEALRAMNKLEQMTGTGKPAKTGASKPGGSQGETATKKAARRWNKEGSEVKGKGRKDSSGNGLFYDLYPRWDSRRRCF